MLVREIPTPALVVDRPRLLANLDRMAARCADAGLALRPHAKTHKCPEIARLQLSRGAAGLAVATVDEAEAFADAGVTDLRVATPVVGAWRHRRLMALAARGVAVSFTVDTELGAAAAGAAWAAEGRTADVLVEVDTGHGRCGVAWDHPETPGFVRRVRETEGLRLRGLLTHGGHAYWGPREALAETPAEALVRAMAEERDRLLDLAARLGAAGLLDRDAELSLGSTPTMSVFEPAERDGWRITEARPGNYAFHDAQQVALGSAALGACALACVATVVSRHRQADGTERVIVDAGKKAMGSDRGWGVDGFGIVLHSPRTRKPMPHARVVALSEEHGWIDVPGGAPFDVGDVVWIVPNHACVAVQQHARLVVAEADEVTGTWERVAWSREG